LNDQLSSFSSHHIIPGGVFDKGHSIRIISEDKPTKCEQNLIIFVGLKDFSEATSTVKYEKQKHEKENKKCLLSGIISLSNQIFVA
jgi:hypothetical protein